MPILMTLLILLALFLGACWWRQARRDWRLLTERMSVLASFMVREIAMHYHRPHRPYVAKWLAERLYDYRIVAYPKDRAEHYRAMRKAMVEVGNLTFDGERFHAPGPPRKPKEETNENLSDD